MDIFCNYVYTMSSFRIILIGFSGIFRIKKAEVKNSKTETVEVSKCHCSECHKKVICTMLWELSMELLI